jgi:hypothetical protein
VDSSGIIFSQPVQKGYERSTNGGIIWQGFVIIVGAICAASRDVVSMIICSAVAGFAGLDLIVDGVIHMLRRGERDAGMEGRSLE